MTLHSSGSENKESERFQLSYKMLNLLLGLFECRERFSFFFFLFFWKAITMCGKPQTWIDAPFPHSLNWMAMDWFIWKLNQSSVPLKKPELCTHTHMHTEVCAYTFHLRSISTPLNHVMRSVSRHLDPLQADLDNGSVVLQHLTLSVSVCVCAKWSFV